MGGVRGKEYGRSQRWMQISTISMCWYTVGSLEVSHLCTILSLFAQRRCESAYWILKYFIQHHNFHSCGWIGAQHDFFAHMKSKHGENGAFFTHWHNGRIEFDSAKNCTKFNLIDAFNRKFVFLYMSHARNANLFFLIYLLGRKSDAQKFMIDFELRNDMRKIKFIETCYSDAGNIAELIKDHNCFILPKKLVESYAVNGSLEFRFVIKRKDDIKLENAEKQQFLKANVFHASSQSLANVTTAKPSIKVYQSETNLVMAAQPSNRSNGSAKGKSRYRRQPKNWISFPTTHIHEHFFAKRHYQHETSFFTCFFFNLS